MANKQVINGIRLYSRHSADCAHADDASYLDCSCRKWLQYQLSGKQIKESAGTRNSTQAKLAAERKSKELSGELTPVVKAIAIDEAIKDWVTFRERNHLGFGKATRLGKRLVTWAKNNRRTFLHQITTADLISFRDSLNYQSKTSNSLKIHWGVICGFFGWCKGSKRIKENPVPSSHEFPQFRLKVKKIEVVPPAAKDVDLLIAAIENVPDWDAQRKHRMRLFLLTQRHTGMAIIDIARMTRDKLTDNLIRSNRSKTTERFRVRIPAWLAGELRGLQSGDPDYFFWLLGEDGRRQKYIQAHYHTAIRKLCKIAKVKVTSHGLRHLFISENLAAGIHVEDVSKMVGTSPQEIRKTYQHWIKEDEDRMDDIHTQRWLQAGLDEEGNKITIQ